VLSLLARRRAQVDEFRKHCLLNGLDDIGLTLQKNGETLNPIPKP